MFRNVTAILALVTVACSSLTPLPGTSASPQIETRPMYYVESQRIEPWAPEISGVQPPDWKTTSLRDFNAVGLHPTSVTQRDFRATVTDLIVCTGCSDGFALEAAMPVDEVALALTLCFVLKPPDFTGSGGPGNLPASRRTDCKPFYRRP